jgi:hypothetical protein
MATPKHRSPLRGDEGETPEPAPTAELSPDPEGAGDPAWSRGTWIGFLVWVAGFLFLLLLLFADLLWGLFFRG